MTNYKPTYTKEEMEDLAAWFEARMDKLPQTFRLNGAATSLNLPITVKALISNAKNNYGNVNFSGLVAQLFDIREKLKVAGIE